MVLPNILAFFNYIIINDYRLIIKDGMNILILETEA